MSNISCIYYPINKNKKRRSCRKNKTGDGRNMVDDCVINSKTNRCILTDKHRKSRIKQNTKYNKSKKKLVAIIESQKMPDIVQPLQSIPESDEQKAKNKANPIQSKEEREAYIRELINVEKDKIEKTRMRLRKAFNVRKNEPDTSAIMNELRRLRNEFRLRFYNEYKVDPFEGYSY